MVVVTLLTISDQQGDRALLCPVPLPRHGGGIEGTHRRLDPAPRVLKNVEAVQTSRRHSFARTPD